VEELAAVEGIGPVIADSIVEFLSSPGNRGVIEKLRVFGVNMTEPGAPGVARTTIADVKPAQTLAGRSVVVTGTLDGYSREEAAEAIMRRGGKSPGGVSSKTWAVVVGSEPGTAKLRKAEELQVPVVDGSHFEELLSSGELPGD